MLHGHFDSLVYSHLGAYLISLECQPLAINGMPDHVHMLFMQSPRTNLIDIVRRVKGESFFWINKSSFIEGKFAWQEGFSAFTVSHSIVSKVEKYIRNQKEHHKNLSFDEENLKLIALHNK